LNSREGKDKLRRGSLPMDKKRPQKVWTYRPQAPKFTADDKARIVAEVKDIVRQLPKVSKKLSRLEIRGNRIYMHELVEFRPEGAVYAKPLIDNAYLECPYARITMQDAQGNDCTADWQRHNNRWMALYAGTLAECLGNIENDDCGYWGTGNGEGMH
jgi:hypothetical protein